jgi:hypothetical protein
MQSIREFEGTSPQVFRDEILQSAKPAVFRGLVADWPIVAAAITSDETFCDYLKRFDRGYDVDTAYGPPSIRGRLFYNEDLSGLNFRMGKSRIDAALRHVMDHAGEDPAPTLAIQSVVISRYLPGLELENRLPGGLIPSETEARLWVGSRGVVAAHFDVSENIACCVAGSRRFTVFPPEQVGNLYVGPFELTPAGATISMVDFHDAATDRYPKFAAALEAAYEAELRPGDAIYIPYLWWHHVQSLNDVNALVNYWWGQANELYGNPRNVLTHAMMSIRSLPPAYRRAWRSMFEHYVFDADSGAGEHLPESRRGILGDPGVDYWTKLRQGLSRILSRS